MEASPHPSFSLPSTLSLPLPAKPGGCPSRVLHAPMEPRQPGTTLQGQVEKEVLGGGEGILQGTPNLTQPTTSCKCWGDGAGVSAVRRHPAGPEREGGLGSGLHGAWHCGLHSGRWHREEPPRLGRQLCEEVGREAVILVRAVSGRCWSATVVRLFLTMAVSSPGPWGQLRRQRPGPRPPASVHTDE